MTDEAPAIGATVHDPAQDKIGEVMGHEGPYLQLRPLSGGREWDADPRTVRTLTRSETLHALVAEADARSRRKI